MWSWQFLFDNGTQASLNFTWARLGFKDPVCGADLSLAGFRGRSYSVGREYPEDRFQQQAAPFQIQIHPEIWARGLLFIGFAVSAGALAIRPPGQRRRAKPKATSELESTVPRITSAVT